MPVLLCLAFSTLAGRALASWTAPDTAPPGGNVAAPINTSATPQTKNGDLTIAGNYLRVATGDLFISTADRGVFWSNVSDTAKPHINFGANSLYLSPGETGDHIELQGAVKITAASPTNLATLSIQNPNMVSCGGLSTDADGTITCGGAAGGGFWTQDVNDLYPTNPTANVGIGDITPLSPLTVGNGDKFMVDATGNIIRIKGVTYNWPNNNLGADNDAYLKNDGSGNLSWAVVAAGGGIWKAGSTADTIAPTNETTDKVAIGRLDISDNTRLSVTNAATAANDKTLYAEITGGQGFAGYFSGKTVIMNGAVGIGVENPAAGTKLEVQGGTIKATDGLVIQVRTAAQGDPASPAVGQMWLVLN